MANIDNNNENDYVHDNDDLHERERDDEASKMAEREASNRWPGT